MLAYIIHYYLLHHRRQVTEQEFHLREALNVLGQYVYLPPGNIYDVIK